MGVCKASRGRPVTIGLYVGTLKGVHIWKLHCIYPLPSLHVVEPFSTISESFFRQMDNAFVVFSDYQSHSVYVLRC